MDKEIKQSAIKKCLVDILILHNDLEKIGHKVTPDIVGFYGELVAWQKLKSVFGPKGYKVKFGSGHSKADIVLWKGSKKVKIEVKTSRLKEENPGTVYGFAINIKKCKCHPNVTYDHPKKGKIKGDFCYFDYLLAVTLPDNMEKPKFYIFSRKFIDMNKQSLRNKSKHFSSGSHRIIFIETLKDPEEITSLDKRLTKNKKEYQNAWHLI